MFRGRLNAVFKGVIVSWVKFGAILIGDALGASVAIMCIEFFHSNSSQLGYVAACAIFGGIVCAVISAAFPQHASASRRSDLLKNSDAGELPKSKRGHSADSPPLSPK